MPHKKEIPIVPYPGGKGRWSNEIESFVPKYGHRYYEPFAGRLNIFLAVALSNPKRFHSWHLNDTKQAPFYKAIRNYGHKVRIPTNLREAYYTCQKNKLSNRSLLLEPLVSRDGGGYGSGGPAGEHTVNPSRYRESLRAGYRLMRQTKPIITDVDWKELRLENCTSDDFVVFDPPYFKADVRAYSSKGFDYIGLVDLLSRARFKWLLMEYEQDFYVRAFGKPFFKKVVSLGSALKPGRKVECMWKNYTDCDENVIEKDLLLAA
jgi:site-specific DNA-adenine methylase